MATPEIFLDTAGVLALWDSRDEHHKHAVKIQQEAARKKRRFVTTDYILDESVTLLLIRHSHAAASDFIDTIEKTGFLKVKWSTSEKFFAATSLFRKHDDKDWSFTDCVSFVTMKELKLRDAFTSDHHFEEAGYVPLLLKKPTLSIGKLRQSANARSIGIFHFEMTTGGLLIFFWISLLAW